MNLAPLNHFFTDKTIKKNEIACRTTVFQTSFSNFIIKPHIYKNLR